MLLMAMMIVMNVVPCCVGRGPCLFWTVRYLLFPRAFSRSLFLLRVLIVSVSVLIGFGGGQLNGEMFLVVTLTATPRACCRSSLGLCHTTPQLAAPCSIPFSSCLVPWFLLKDVRFPATQPYPPLPQTLKKYCFYFVLVDSAGCL